MTDNPKSYEVILLDHYEMKHDESGEYLSAFNLDGTNYKINAKRQALWGAFTRSVKGTPILLTFETFTPLGSKESIKYVVDAQVADFDAVWKAGIQSTLRRLLLAKDDDRNRSLALSYAKDILVAQFALQPNTEIPPMTTTQTLQLATTFFEFIKGMEEVEVPPIEAHEKEVAEEEYQK